MKWHLDVRAVGGFQDQGVKHVELEQLPVTRTGRSLDSDATSHELAAIAPTTNHEFRADLSRSFVECIESRDQRTGKRRPINRLSQDEA